MPNPGLLAALLKTGRLTGALLWKVELSQDEIATEQSASGFKAIQLDTTGVTDLTDFFAVAAKQLNLPHCDLTNFESNLKTLACEPGLFVVWSGWEKFVKENFDDANAVTQIFDEVSKTWPGVVLLVGKNGKFKDLAQLTSA